MRTLIVWKNTRVYNNVINSTQAHLVQSPQAVCNGESWEVRCPSFLTKSWLSIEWVIPEIYFLHPPRQPGKHLFWSWRGAEKAFQAQRDQTISIQNPSVPTGPALNGTGLADHLSSFEHTFHSSRYLTSKCLTFHFQKLDNTIKCQWSCEDHWKQSH